MPRIQAEALSKKMRYWAPKKRKKSRSRLTKTKRRLVNKLMITISGAPGSE